VARFAARGDLQRASETGHSEPTANTVGNTIDWLDAQSADHLAVLRPRRRMQPPNLCSGEASARQQSPQVHDNQEHVKLASGGEDIDGVAEAPSRFGPTDPPGPRVKVVASLMTTPARRARALEHFSWAW